MENTQKEQQETINQIYAYANNLLVKEEKNAEDVKTILVEQGINTESASVVVENLLLEKSQKKENANKDMLYGALWCVGGIIGTMANIGFIFWGAILFGAIQFIKGVSNSN
jgi:hypothetical protein